MHDTRFSSPILLVRPLKESHGSWLGDYLATVVFSVVEILYSDSTVMDKLSNTTLDISHGRNKTGYSSTHLSESLFTPELCCIRVETSASAKSVIITLCTWVSNKDGILEIAVCLVNENKGKIQDDQIWVYVLAGASFGLVGLPFVLLLGLPLGLPRGLLNAFGGRPRFLTG